MSFRLKTIIGIAVIEGALLLLLIWMGLNLIQDSQEDALLKRASTVATLFATITKAPVLSSDLASLESFVEEVMANPSLRYARVLDREGQVMAGRGHPDGQGAGSGGALFHASEDILEGGESYGRVEIGLGGEAGARLLEEAKSNAIALALLEMSLVALFSLVLGSWLTRQIKALEHGAKLVSAGGLGHQLPVRGHDELARTTQAFNQMSHELKEAYDALSDANNELERQVRERSQELQLIYRVSELMVDLDIPLDELFRTIVNAIAGLRSGWGKACARILFDGDSYESDNYAEGFLTVAEAIVVAGHLRGKIELTCLTSQADCGRKSYQLEKKPLLEAVSKDLGLMIAHRSSLRERQDMEVQLRHAHKMEAVGQLAAGIAHEVNTPTQFVSDNMHFLDEAFADYRRLLERYKSLAGEHSQRPGEAASFADIKALEKEIDLDFLNAEMPQAIEQSQEGLQRISKIVKAMKHFSYPSAEQKVPLDLREQIEATIEVSRNEWKYHAKVETEFDLGLPRVPLLADEFKQVILNLLINAVHAIEEAGRKDGVIRISTAQEGDQALVRVSDNGRGIPAAIRERVFDPFFTTKEIGKGTGQGLAIAYSIIVDQHQGRLEVGGEQGAGACFEIRLPLA